MKKRCAVLLAAAMLLSAAGCAQDSKVLKYYFIKGGRHYGNMYAMWCRVKARY